MKKPKLTKKIFHSIHQQNNNDKTNNAYDNDGNTILKYSLNDNDDYSRGQNVPNHLIKRL